MTQDEDKTVDPYGWAMGRITEALEYGLGDGSGTMSEDEFGTLGIIAETVQEVDPACSFKIPRCFKHRASCAVPMDDPVL